MIELQDLRRPSDFSPFLDHFNIVLAGSVRYVSEPADLLEFSSVGNRSPRKALSGQTDTDVKAGGELD